MSTLRRDSYEFAGSDEECEEVKTSSICDSTASPMDFATVMTDAEADAILAKEAARLKSQKKNEDAQDYAAMPTKTVAPKFIPGQCLNRGILNARGFYESEVTFKLTASLKDLSKYVETKGREGVAPVLSLKKSSRAFELPDTSESKGRINMHAQGNIYLSEIRSTFPVSIMLSMGDKLRGVNNVQCSADGSRKGSFVAFPMDHTSFRNDPHLLVESNIGDMTHDYVKTYPSYLEGKSFMDAVEDVKGNDKVCLVDISSPIVDMVNTTRQENDLDELLPDDSAKALGSLVMSRVEVAEAVKSLKACLDVDVNYVKLYDAFKIRISRPFFERTSSNRASNEWLDKDELEVAKSQNDADAGIGRKYVLHVRTIVEHKPHVSK